MTLHHRDDSRGWRDRIVETTYTTVEEEEA